MANKKKRKSEATSATSRLRAEKSCYNQFPEKERLNNNKMQLRRERDKIINHLRNKIPKRETCNSRKEEAAQLQNGQGKKKKQPRSKPDRECPKTGKPRKMNISGKHRQQCGGSTK